MKRLLPLLMILFILSSCNLSILQVIDGKKADEDRNTFMIQEAFESPTSFSLLLVTDIHFDRHDNGVYYRNNQFFDWIQENQSDFPNLDTMICLGDITENSSTEEFNRYASFRNDLIKKTNIREILTIKGNHDIRPDTNHMADWKNIIRQPEYQAVAYKGISFYLLNTANRTLGKTQLKELQEATKQDPRPKIFFSHMPLYGKPSLVYFALQDNQEREEIISLLVRRRGMLFLAGHHHQGDVLYSFTPTTTEFILGAFHGRDSLFEQTKPRWYILDLNVEAQEIKIIRYQVEPDSDKPSRRVMATLHVTL